MSALRIESPVHLDGLLEEPAWNEALPATGFIQKELVEGDPATEKTEVRILYDRNNVYIGIMCFDSSPDAIIHNEMDRDVEPKSDDSFTLVLDTFDSMRSGYFFTVNPNGARYDGYFHGTQLINKDWDGVWDTSARITPEGWSAEIMIPFKTLRFPNTPVQLWGVNFKRIIRRKNEEALWSSWKRDDGIFQLTKAGKLNGIENVTKGRKVEVEPYILGGMERQDKTDNREFKFGGDITYPIATDLSLDITSHTDFAQVETDKEQINLTRFSLFYPEKRDFFLEGADSYDFDTEYVEKVFHSRRIGISPEREQVPIIGGVNLSGRIGSYSLGVLDIQTDRKGSSPDANNMVVRLKKDVLEKSHVGFIATNLYDAKDHINTTVGGDFLYQTNRLFGNKNFTIRGDLTGSFIDGEHEDNLFSRLFIDYPNDLIDSFWELYYIGKKFNPELGFITRKGIRRVNGAFRYYPRPHIPGVNKLIFKPLGIDYKESLDGRMLERTLTWWLLGVLTTTDDLVRLEVDNSYDDVDESFTMFGDVAVPPGSYSWTQYGVYVLTNQSRRLSVELKTRNGSFYDGDRGNYQMAWTFTVNRHLAVSADANYNNVELGEGRFIAREYGARIRANLSTKLTTNTFLQWNNETREVNMNFRLHYLPNMGSDLYFVYNHLCDESAGYRTKYRTGIVKVSYLFRF